jgi:hypothetical protein
MDPMANAAIAGASPSARASRAAAVVLIAVALAGCGGADPPSPTPLSVTPDRGSAGSATPVVVHGSSFTVLTVQPASGGGPSVDDTFQAWMGDLPLQDVRRVDAETLSAIVPAGLTPGSKTLRVQGPFGTSGELPNAFTVEPISVVSISVVIAVTPVVVSVG